MDILKIHEAIDDMIADCAPGPRMKASAAILTTLYRLQREEDRAITDAEAAKLLPLGADVVAIRQECHRSTAYRRAERARLSRQIAASATKA